MKNRTSRWVRKILSLTTIAVVSVSLSACAQAQAQGKAFVQTEGLPAWINPTQCTVKEGQYPVVLIHGTFANVNRAFSSLGPILAREGYCVYGLNYGGLSSYTRFFAQASMEDSAKVIAQFIEDVKVKTSASKVDLIGHSQGGTLVHYYIKMLNGADSVNKAIAVAPSIRGTTLVDPQLTPSRCEACAEQSPNSALIKALNEGPITQPGVKYYVLATRNDKVVLPLEKQLIDEPGVTNLILQTKYPGKFATHSGILHDRDAVDTLVAWLEAR